MDQQERFPPPITPVRLREHGDAFAHAVRHAAADGAGTLYWVGRFAAIEFAIVLEPEEPLRLARHALVVGMNAVAETIAAEAAPEKPVAFGENGAIHFDHGLIGHARLGVPEGADEDNVPDWLVFGVELAAGGFAEDGFRLDPGITTLEEAGFRDLDHGGFAARFCRHLMTEFEAVTEEGYGPALARFERRRLGRAA